MNYLFFGTAGIPITAKENSTVSGIKRIKELGLNAMELEFVHGVNMKKEKALKVRKTNEKEKIKLSVHAPYYINLNAEKESIVKASIKRIVDSAVIGGIAGAEYVVVHLGYRMMKERKQVMEAMTENTGKTLDKLKEKNCKLMVCGETTGKVSQFGDLDELIELSDNLKSKQFGVCVDFAHLHARGNGCLKNLKDFERILETIKKQKPEWLKELRMHVSGINYSEKGERNHLNLDESDFKYKELLKALKKFKVSGRIICESHNLETDALKMQNYWKQLK
ncbi:MAG: TIM barrel protein [archaeon]